MSIFTDLFISSPSVADGGEILAEKLYKIYHLIADALKPTT